MKKNKSSRNWIINQHRDQYFKKSKILGYRSRSAFKLIELNKKFNFLKKESKLLDIGASPGGWSQVSRELIKNGKILSIDIKPMKEIQGVTFLKSDFQDDTTKSEILAIFDEKLDVIISDMAADTTGNKDLDCIRTNQLCAEVVNFSSKILKKNGTLVSKLFMGEDFIEVKDLAKKYFRNVAFFKPKSSKDFSKETYIHCSILKTL